MHAWQSEIRHAFSNLNSEYEMQLFCSLHVFYKKKYKKTPDPFLLIKNGQKWTEIDRNPTRIFLHVKFGSASCPNRNYSAISARPNRNWELW